MGILKKSSKKSSTSKYFDHYT